MMTTEKAEPVSIVSSNSDVRTEYKVHTRSVTGAKKRRRGKPCEDAVDYKKLKKGIICAVADGHGDKKCKYSSTGAKFAVESACEVLWAVLKDSPTPSALYTQFIDGRDKICKDIITVWNRKVISDFLSRPESNECEKYGIDILAYTEELFAKPKSKMTVEETRAYYERRDYFESILHDAVALYGTTLNVVVVTTKFIFCMGIGDGDIIAVQGKRFNWLLPPAEQFSTKTRSLCMKPYDALASFKCVTITKSKSKNCRSYMESNINPDFIMLSTDGLRNSFLDDGMYIDRMVAINSERQTGYKKFIYNSKRWAEKLSRESVYQDDLTFALLAHNKLK